MSFRAPSSHLSLCALLLAAGCSSESAAPSGAHDAGGDAGRPTSIVNELRTHVAPYVDVPYTEYAVTQYRTAAVLPDVDARAVTVVGPDVYVGTASSVARLSSDGATFASVVGLPSKPVVDLAPFDAASVIVAYGDEVRVVPGGGAWTLTGSTATSVGVHGADVIVGGDAGLSIAVNGSPAAAIAGTAGLSVRDLVLVGDVVWVATSSGVARWDLGTSGALAALHSPLPLADEDVRALAATDDGSEVLVASATGVARVKADGTSATLTTAGVDALPEADLSAVASHGSATLLGHAIGASVQDDVDTRHYHSLRYLPAEQVTGVAFAGDGTRWITTPGGVSRLTPYQTTLDQKQADNEAPIARFTRMGGFVSDHAYYADAYDQTAPPTLYDNDNEGLWTEMNVAAWCFAYKTTGDEAYYVRARAAMDVMLLEIDVPGATYAAKGMKPGFITRSLVRDDEAALFASKATQPNWHLQRFGDHDYYWKDSTSSDEYTGHFFGIPVFHDLCAKTDAERADVAAHLDQVMSALVDGDYLILALDGTGTPNDGWQGLANAVDGVGPCVAQQLGNCVASFGGDGWLNSVQVLGFLLASWHITGNDRYYDEYKKLSFDQRYAEMVPIKDSTYTVSDRHHANHSDHELAILAYHTLLRYEPDATQREVWLKSLRDFLAAEAPERNSFEFGLAAGSLADVDVASAARTLREFPPDWRCWLVDNSYRKDANPDVPDRADVPQFDRVFSYAEIQTVEWNSDPYNTVGGTDGTDVQSPWPWLLPYWALRYYGAIEKP